MSEVSKVRGAPRIVTSSEAKVGEAAAARTQMQRQGRVDARLAPRSASAPLRLEGLVLPQPLRPLVPVPVPDPFAFQAGPSLHLMVGTTNESRDTFAYYSSRDGGLSFRPVMRDGRHLHVFSASQTPAWIHPQEADRWAPEIHRVGDTWVCLYTARHRDGDLRLASATARSPLGPWTDHGPYAKGPHGVIDATIGVDPKSGERAMLYKHDANAVDQPTPIVSQRFSVGDDGVKLLGDPTTVAVSDGTFDRRTWRAGAPVYNVNGCAEGPTVITDRGVAWLIGSSGFFGNYEYFTWIAPMPRGLGQPCGERSVLLSSDSPLIAGKLEGPGHVSAFRVADGVFRVVYHAGPVGMDMKFQDRFIQGTEKRLPYMCTLSFRDAEGRPCAPYILEERAAAL
jgi:hypothetical protein